tara:strand:+ start:368 stop:670 length:303 start_codon:yes stop_codon:yes gene_type:complete
MNHIEKIIADLGKVSGSDIVWKDFSDDSNVCPTSVITNVKDVEVQFFAFETKELAEEEGASVYGVMSVNDDGKLLNQWSGNNRDNAIEKAVEFAENEVTK